MLPARRGFSCLGWEDTLWWSASPGTPQSKWWDFWSSEHRGPGKASPLMLMKVSSISHPSGDHQDVQASGGLGHQLCRELEHVWLQLWGKLLLPPAPSPSKSCTPGAPLLCLLLLIALSKLHCAFNSPPSFNFSKLLNMPLWRIKFHSESNAQTLLFRQSLVNDEINIFLWKFFFFVQKSFSRSWIAGLKYLQHKVRGRNHIYLYFKTQYLEDGDFVKPLASFFQKGDTVDIHGKCFPPPVEWIGAIASYRLCWYFSFPCQNMICMQQLLYLCRSWFTTFHTCFPYWRLSSLLLHLKPKEFFLAAACVPDLCVCHQYLSRPPGRCRMYSFPLSSCKTYCFQWGFNATWNPHVQAEQMCFCLSTWWVCFFKLPVATCTLFSA